MEAEKRFFITKMQIASRLERSGFLSNLFNYTTCFLRSTSV